MTHEECAASAQRALWPIVGALQSVEDALDVFKTLAAEGTTDFMLEAEVGVYFLLHNDLGPLIAKINALAVPSYSDAAWRREERRFQEVN